MNESDFESDLRRLLSERPEPTARADLAARAIALARTSRVRGGSIALWRALTSLAAALIIATVLSVGAWRWLQSTATSDASTVTETSAVSAADVISSRNATMLLIGGAVFVIVLGLVTLDRMLTSDDPMGGAAFV